MHLFDFELIFVDFLKLLVKMKSKDVVAGDSENEFEVDEPEEVDDDHSDDEWAPSAAVS